MTSSGNGRFVVGTRDAWRRVAELVVRRRGELRATQAEAVATARNAGFPMSSATWGLIEAAGRDRYRRSTINGLSWVLGWSPDSVERILDGGDPELRPLPTVEGRPGLEFDADPDALRSGHGGSEGWPPWLEAKFRRLEVQVSEQAGDLADHGRQLEEIREELGRIRRLLEQPGAGRGRSAGTAGRRPLGEAP